MLQSIYSSELISFHPWPTSCRSGGCDYLSTPCLSKTSRESYFCIQVLFTPLHGLCRYNGGCPSAAGSACWAVPELPEAGRSQHQPGCGDLWHPLWQTGKTPEQSGTAELSLNRSNRKLKHLFEWDVGKGLHCSFSESVKLKWLTAITRLSQWSKIPCSFSINCIYFSFHFTRNLPSVYSFLSKEKQWGSFWKTASLTLHFFSPDQKCVHYYPRHRTEAERWPWLLRHGKRGGTFPHTGPVRSHHSGLDTRKWQLGIFSIGGFLQGEYSKK